MKFVDEVTLHVKAGNGGDGCIAFRREKFIPKGGPSGGDGGKGGDIVFVGDTGLSTLVDLRYMHHLKAERGQHGMGSDCYGRAGKDIRVRVPIGTQVFNEETGELMADITEGGQEVIIAKGGKGGRGNMHFSTSTNRAPREAEPGGIGEEFNLRLELKLLADVGLVGFPNAGKSTLISRVSAAKPKIADYPFTTLAPNLGVVRAGEFKSYVIADLPGLIEGASEGAGMGVRFLKHVERCRLLVFLLDSTPELEPAPPQAYDLLIKEIEQFNPALAERKRLIVLSKTDTGASQETLADYKAHFEKMGYPVMAISSVTGDGIEKFIYTVGDILAQMPREEAGESADETAGEVAGS